MKVAVLVDDMIFRSRIAAVARECGATAVFCSSPEAAPEDTDLILVDLEASPHAVDDIAALKTARSTRIVAYVSHVQVELKRRALEAGADSVLARSAFVQTLPELLGRASG